MILSGALENYLQHVNEELIIQEFIPYENELGIFYHRIPGQTKRTITSVTIKKFIKVKEMESNVIGFDSERQPCFFIYRSLLCYPS